VVSFDRIDSDGCMSTNDTVIALANGASGTSPDAGAMPRVLTDVCIDLARQLISDTEGASKDIAIAVHGARSEDEGLEAARAIGRSNLLKWAIHGEDPNWGRVLFALGTTSAAFESHEVDVSINGVMVCRGGGVGDSRDRPVSRKWQDFGLGKVGCGGVNRAEVDLQWAVPGQGLVRSDGVVFDPVVLGVLGQVQAIGDFV